VQLPPENDKTVGDLFQDRNETPEKIALIDVRPVEQFNIVNIPGSINIPEGSVVKGEQKALIDELTTSHDKVYIL